MSWIDRLLDLVDITFDVVEWFIRILFVTFWCTGLWSLITSPWRSK